MRETYLMSSWPIVAANNHYAGVGPATANIFRQILGLKEVNWGNEYLATDASRN